VTRRVCLELQESERIALRRRVAEEEGRAAVT